MSSNYTFQANDDDNSNTKPITPEPITSEPITSEPIKPEPDNAQHTDTIDVSTENQNIQEPHQDQDQDQGQDQGHGQDQGQDQDRDQEQGQGQDQDQEQGQGQDQDQEQTIEMQRLTHLKNTNDFPMIYDYWIKFAEFEMQNNNHDYIMPILKKALVTLPMCIDLWIYYTTYLRHYKASDEDLIRNTFKMAVQICGLDFYSDQLWHDYIQWEHQKRNFEKVFLIFTHLLSVPTQGCLQNFNKFQNFIYNNSLEAMFNTPMYPAINRRTNLFLLFRNIYFQIPEHVQITSTSVNRYLATFLKVKIVKTAFYKHLKTNRTAFSRLPYEESVMLPEFQDPETLKENWRQYINFEKNIGKRGRIIFLYEKCLQLTLCATDEQFWLDYLSYLKSLNDNAEDLIRLLLEKACFIHHPLSMALHLEYINFEKGRGNFEFAELILNRMEFAYPNSTELAKIRMDLRTSA